MKFNVQPKGGMLRDILLAVSAVLAAAAVILCVRAVTSDLFAPKQAFATLVLYEGPKPIPASETVSMKVDGHDLFVFDTAVNNTHTWKNDYRPSLSAAPVTSFDFEGGPVTLEITVKDQQDLGEVTVRPRLKGVEPQVEGNTITMTLPEPDTYTVEWGGSAMNAAHIFANPIDHDAPTESSENVKYIGPGAWIIDTMPLKSGMEVYISGGAVIHGMAVGNKAENVKVWGHGIFDGSNHDSWMLSQRTAYVPMNLSGCKNVEVRGIAMLDPNAWTLNLFNCDNVTVDGVKIISARPNGDGITVQSCRDVTVKDCFVRTWDDSLVVKNYCEFKDSDSARITFDGCQVWTDLAQCMEVGYETNKGQKLRPTLTDVTFQNITVLHSFHKPVMSIHNADDAAVSGIRYKNIVVEDASMGKGDSDKNAQLIDITIESSSWSSTTKRGTVSDVEYDGIYVLWGDDTIDFREGNLCPIRFSGADAEHLCSDVTVKNLFIQGELVTDENVLDNPSTSISKFTENIHFINDTVLPEDIGAVTIRDAQ